MKINKVIWSVFILLNLIFISSVFADNVILNGQNSEIDANDSNTLDGFSQATWNIWVKQNQYTTNAGLIGKYSPTTGGRSYLIRTSLVDGISVVISNDGTNTGSYSSSSDRHCGIRNNNEWTMITIVYSGTQIKYYRNGQYCDTDSTTLNKIADSSSQLRLGGGNNIFFNGSIDDANIYNRLLTQDQITRLYDENSHGKNKGQSIPVLVYHRIETPTPDLIKVSPGNFNQQMQFLKNNSFTTITTRDYNNWKKGTFSMPKKAVIIFFDDGWQTVYTNARPVMNSNNFKGNLGTVVNYADQLSGKTYMDWTQIRTLANSGWAIESHGISHAHMLKLNLSQFTDQLKNSKTKISQEIGTTPESFVFPFHESNSTYTQICGQYYDLCWTQGSADKPSYDFKSTNGKVYLSLRRINIVNYTTLQQFNNLLGKDTNKAGEWLFDEGSGSIAYDSSGNSNNAVLKNAMWSTQATLVTSIQQNPEKVKSKNPEHDKPKHLNEGLGGHIVDTDNAKKSHAKDDEKNASLDNMPIEKDSDFV